MASQTANTVTAKALSRELRAGLDARFEVHSSDPMVYVAFCCQGDHRRAICGSGRFKRQFPSRYAAYKALYEIGVQELTFVHRSAYGEMIGLEGQGSSNEYRETIRLAEIDF